MRYMLRAYQQTSRMHQHIGRCLLMLNEYMPLDDEWGLS